MIRLWRRLDTPRSLARGGDSSKLKWVNVLYLGSAAVASGIGPALETGVLLAPGVVSVNVSGRASSAASPGPDGDADERVRALPIRLHERRDASRAPYATSTLG